MANSDYKNEDLRTVKEHERFAERKGTDTPIEEIVNGSMAPNLEEVRRLGQDMKKVKTETELKEKGLVSDPIQQE
jgi:hypothetical protein